MEITKGQSQALLEMGLASVAEISTKVQAAVKHLGTSYILLIMGDPAEMDLARKSAWIASDTKTMNHLWTIKKLLNGEKV